uniref:Uncharacterized protein n=1 Tax=Romanomermis culicivorax TaxID=13658 RepID=A0A915HYT5_ROMCU
MSGVNGIDNTELFGPEAGNPSEDKCGNVRRHGGGGSWYVGGIGGANMDGHGDANPKAAEEVNQDRFLQNLR